MHEIRVSIVSPEAADHGVAELWAADELIGYTILEDSDLMLRIEPRRDRTALSSVRAASRKRSVEPSAYSSIRDARSPEQPPTGRASTRIPRRKVRP
jgi:hypothetical protein